MSLSLYPLVPVWLLLALAALAAAATAYTYRRRNPVVSPLRHRLLLALRLLAVACVFLLLLCPGRLTEERNLDRSHIVFLLDRSASMGAADLPHGETRLARAAAFLARTRFPHLADYPTAYYSFNAQTLRHTAPAEATALTAQGGTDLKAAIARVDRDIGLNRTAALVLLSDGLDTSGYKGSETATPLFGVHVGTDLAQTRDLSIEAFPYPPKVNVGSELSLDIPLLAQGYPHEVDAAVTVSLNGQPVHRATPRLTSGRPHTVSLQTTLDRPGAHVFRIDCPSLPDEATALNNRREFIIETVEAQDAVAAYFPLLNNGLRPLLREFLKSETGRFTALYRVSETAFRVTGRPPDARFSEGLPANPAHLRDYACLILGAHNNDLLKPAEALALEHYVAAGGALICLGGADSFGRLPADSPLLKLLPVVPAEAPLRHGAFRLAPDPLADRSFAGQLERIIADNPDPASLTLASVNPVADVKAGAKVVLWAEADTRLPLLVWHPYGRGKVVALLSNALHLWGAPETRDANFGRFWRQLVAFARNPDDDADLLRVSLPKTELAEGERVTVSAVARPPDSATNLALTVTADVFPADSPTPVQSLTLEPKAGCFLGELRGYPPGRYVLRVSAAAGPEPVRTRYTLLLVGDALAESATLRSTRDAFRPFCAERNLFTPDQPDRLQEALLGAVRKNVLLREQFPLFESPALLAVTILLLLTEWFLRRRFNLF